MEPKLKQTKKLIFFPPTFSVSNMSFLIPDSISVGILLTRTV